MGKIIEDYVLQQEIGSGAFGKVFKAYHIQTRETVAIKAISKEMFRITPKLEDCIQNEIANLRLVQKNNHIITYIKGFKTSNNFYMVYQYCNGGTLFQYLKTKGSLLQKEALKIFQELLEAFKDMKKHQIIHRDLKPENIFIHNGVMKLGDFGFSKALKQGDPVTTTMIGSPIYMAPQVIKGQAYTSKADIWSLGVILYEMLYGSCPFYSNSIAGLIMSLNNDHLIFPKTDNFVSQKIIDILKKMLEKDQFNRISWSQLFSCLKQQKQIIRNQFPKLLRPLSNNLSFKSSGSSTSLFKQQKKQSRTLSIPKYASLKMIESSKTDSTFNTSKGTIQEQLNLSNRFQLNRLLNNLSSQINQLFETISQTQQNQIVYQISSSHKSKIQAANLAVDIFIDDHKQGSLFYYLLLSQVKLQLLNLKSSIPTTTSFTRVHSILEQQLQLIQKQLTIVKQYLSIKGISVDDILDISAYIQMKQRTQTRKTQLWNKMVKYFKGENKSKKYSKSFTMCI